MRRWHLARQLQRICVVRYILLVGLLTLTAGFDIDAHDAIGQTAASAMDQQAVKQVKRLLGGQDASDVAGWGHQVDDTFPGMARLHFQTHDDRSGEPFCGPAQTRVARCEDNICLVSAIKHFYGTVLKDEGRKIDYPDINYRKVEKGITFSDADSVKMLINLVGDLHQPMHVGFAGDDHGRATQVIFKGKQMSLYDVWDKAISEAIRTEESNFWLGGWTHIRAVSQEFEQDKQLWKTEGAFKAIEKWYGESVEFACKTAYTHPSTGKKLAGPDAEKGIQVIDDSAYMVWRQEWLRLILLAGERTAIVLNDILDAGGAQKLHEGSKVQTKADIKKAEEQKEWGKERERILKAERLARGTAHFNPRIFFCNLCIAAVTVPVFLLVANYGLNPYAYRMLIRSLLEASENSGGSGSTAASSTSNAKRWE